VKPDSTKVNGVALVGGGGGGASQSVKLTVRSTTEPGMKIKMFRRRLDPELGNTGLNELHCRI